MILLQAGIAIAFIFMLFSIFGLVIAVPLLVYFIKSKNRNYENYNSREKIIYNIGAILFAIFLVFGSLFILLVIMFNDTIN
jgi:uncharacterized Tic20 family protein